MLLNDNANADSDAHFPSPRRHHIRPYDFFPSFIIKPSSGSPYIIKTVVKSIQMSFFRPVRLLQSFHAPIIAISLSE